MTELAQNFTGLVVAFQIVRKQGLIDVSSYDKTINGIQMLLPFHLFDNFITEAINMGNRESFQKPIYKRKNVLLFNIFTLDSIKRVIKALNPVF